MIYLVLFLFLLVGGALTVLSIQNLVTAVSLQVFTVQTQPLPLGLLLLVSFILGALLLYIIAALWAWRDMRDIRKLRQQVRDLQSANPLVVPVSPSGISAVPMPGMPNPNAEQPPQPQV